MTTRRLTLPILGALAFAGGAWSPFHTSAHAASPSMIPSEEYQNAAWASRASVARLIARVGVLSIRSAGAEPSDNDFALTAGILGLANELNPGDLDILRRSIDAWQGANRPDRVADLTARLVELDPEDRVAQLRLISSRINNLQTAESRLRAYDRLVGPAGNAIDASVRSRLALDAALLAREMGDDAGFIDRLTRATQLDSTNKDAAALAASIVLESDSDELARAEALLNVVIADPMDASSHANLSRELRGAGAFESALRFRENADAIYAAEGRYDNPEITYERLLTYWGYFGPETVATMLDDRERALRTNRTNEIQAYQAAGRQPPPGPAPEQVTLEPILESLRAAANIALGRSNRVETTTRLLTQEAASAQQIIAQASQQGADPAQINQATERLKAILSELLWLRLWAGVQIADAESLLVNMRDNAIITDPVALRRYEGIVALRKGDFATAQERLEGIVDVDPRARLGMALLEETRGNRRAAAANLAPLALEQTGSMLGLYARSTIERLLESPVAPSRTALRIDEYFRSVPSWLDNMTRDPREFMILEASWPQPSIHPLDGMPLTIRLRNIGRVPLPIGPNLTVNSRLLLSPDPTVGGQKSPNRLQPEVAELNRALRVMPGQGTEILVNTDLGAVGLIFDNAATQVATIRWQIAQGFLVDQQGTFYRGPTSVSATSPLITRRRLSIPDESVDGIARALGGAQGDRVLEVLLVYRDIAIRTLALEDRAFATEITNAILQSTAARMPRMSEIERAAAVLLVSSVYPREVLTPVDEIAFADQSQLVRTCALLTRINDPDHPAFARLIQDGSDSLDELTIALQNRLRAAKEFAERQRQSQNAPPAQGQQGLRFDPSAK